MSTTTGQLDVTQLIGVADSLAAGLAGDGLLCGPAAAQDDASALVLTEDLRGAWAELDDGTAIVVVATVLGAGRLFGSDDVSSVVAAVSPAFETAAATLGRTVATTRPIIDPETMVNTLTPTAASEILVGAGIFDGDQAIAAIGIKSGAGPVPFDDAIESSGPIDAPSPAPAGAASTSGSGVRNLHLLADVTLGVTAQLGSATMTMGNLLDLQPGGVIELDREAGTPIDVLVNGTLIARGEVVVIDSHYAVRITEVVADGDAP